MTLQVPTTSSRRRSGATTTGASATASSGATTAPSASERLLLGYARTSTDHDDQATSLQRQVQVLQSSGCTLVLQETGSATSADRPEYQQLLSLVEAGLVAEVRMLRDDRGNRNQAEALHLLRLCQLKNTALVFLEDSLWQTVSADPLAAEEVFHDRAQAAAAESRKISSRLKRSYATAERNGLSTVRKAPLGYMVRNSVVMPDHRPIGRVGAEMVSEWEAARRLVDAVIRDGALRTGRNNWHLWLSSLEPIEGSKRLEQLLRFSAAAAGHWLNDPTIRGGRKGRVYRQEYNPNTRAMEWVENDVVEVVWGQHEALLSVEEHQQIEQLRAVNRGSRTFARRTDRQWHPIHQLLRCEHCGSNWTKVSSGKGHVTYYCCKRQRNKTECSAPGINHKLLIDQWCKVLSEMAHDLVRSVGPAPRPSGEIGKLRQRLARYEALLADDPEDEAMKVARAKASEDLKRLEHEAREATSRHAGTLEQALQMSDPDHWKSILQDPVEGHQELVRWVEWAKVLKGEISEVKIRGLDQSYWVPADEQQ